ncbi:MAG: hypothetical protein ABIR62_07910 [Dokdonella sp.]|uniref:hypothetical protein n=1 Tax=Dokdonella sp. TaxID=2291710 RepID=UPI003265490B
MSKYIWLLVLILPMWAAVELDAPKWVSVLTALPFFLRAATLGDEPDEHLLGENFDQSRPSILVILGIGGLVLGAAFLVLFRALL